MNIYDFMESIQIQLEDLDYTGENGYVEGVSRIFREDEAVLEAQQQALKDHPQLSFHNLNIDSGAVRARRLMDAMVAREQVAKTIPIVEVV
jgi:hypothetical protein